MADNRSLEEEKKEKIEKKRYERAIMQLERLDKILEDMIDQIAIQKDVEDERTGGATIIDADVTRNFTNIVNAIRTDGNEELLMKINTKYERAIEALKDAIENDEDKYKNQFKYELDKIIKNKDEKYEPIAETYRELSGRLERGEVQRDYFQDMADKKQVELDVNEEYYKEKMGNGEELAYILKPEREKIAQKEEIQQKYQELVKLNKRIEKIEEDLNNPDLEEDDKKELEKNLESLKEEREQAVKEFEKTARDKDGNKYVKAEGKSDKDYINELDKDKIQEAIDEAYASFKNKLNGIDPDKRKITILDQNLQERGEVDLGAIIANGSDKDAIRILDEIEIQKKLWKAKMKSQGFDKTKLQKEKQEYQEKANSYSGTNEIYDTNEEYNYPVESKKFDWRHPILSIKRMFKRRNQDETTKTKDENFNLKATKKEALRYLENNKERLAKVNPNDKKRNREKYLNNLNYNVSLTEKEINDFWNKESSKDIDEEER